MKQYKLYYPYKSDRPEKKYFVVVNNGQSNTNKQLFKKVYFGATGYEHYTEGHLDDDRRILYQLRHKENEKWGYTGALTAGFWSYWYLWKYKTYNEAYKKIQNLLKFWGFPVGAIIML
jgi:hypothetical protein